MVGSTVGDVVGAGCGDLFGDPVGEAVGVAVGIGTAAGSFDDRGATAAIIPVNRYKAIANTKSVFLSI